MILLNDLFYIKTLAADNNYIKAAIEVNTLHQVFEGHFPDHPVLPGVCMMQLAKELIEEIIGRQTMLVKCDYLKFLSVVDPRIDAVIQTELTYTTGEEIAVTAAFKNNNTTCFKFKGALSLNPTPQSSASHN